jgi:uncharacterized protein YPO0396
MKKNLDILAKMADIEADVASKYAKVAANAQMGQYVNGTRNNQPNIATPTSQINTERTRAMNALKAEQTQVNAENQKATANRQAARNAATKAKQNAQAAINAKGAEVFPAAEQQNIGMGGGRRRALRMTRRVFRKKHGTKRR